jgi:hypothetical protein
MTYAAKTKVSPQRSKIEIEKTLRRYGANGFFSSWQEGERPTASIGFQMDGRTIRMDLVMPDPGDHCRNSAGAMMSKTQAQQCLDGAIRQRWRALLLIVKAKLEAIELGVSTVEREFMADVLLPDGRRLADAIGPQIEQMHLDGKMPPLLGGGS